jgi:hypothetical protein
MEHRPEVPQSVIDEYNDKINKEVARLDQYRKSLQEEYEKRVIDEADTRYRAMRVFSDSIHDVASRIIDIATERNIDVVPPATSLKAAQYVYDRVIGNSDAPEKDDMELLLERLKQPVASSASSDLDPDQDIPDGPTPK